LRSGDGNVEKVIVKMLPEATRLVQIRGTSVVLVASEVMIVWNVSMCSRAADRLYARTCITRRAHDLCILA
jgi:hypothetical protein